MQVMVALMVAGVPAGTEKPAVSTLTEVLEQRSPCWVRESRAAVLAAAWAAGAVRARDAVRAASAAAWSTDWPAMTTRPAKTTTARISSIAGATITISSVIDPRSPPS